MHVSLTRQKQLWQSYVKNGKADEKLVKPVILRSWERCTRYQVNPFKVNVDHYLSTQAFREKLEVHERFVYVAKPIIKDLYEQLQGTNCLILLINPEGYILSALGDPEICEEVSKIQLVERALWHEQSKGTNAIGTALMEKRPVMVIGAEHFCEAIHYFSCFASPVFNPEGVLCGLLDVTVFSEDSHVYTMGSVVTAARAIETKLFCEKLKDELMLSYRKSDMLGEYLPEGLVSIDRDGLITQINSIGSELLGFTTEQCIGKEAGEIFNLPVAELLAKNSTKETPFIIKKGSLHLISRAKPLIGLRGEKYGLVVTFKQKENKITETKAKGQVRYHFEGIIGQSKQLQEVIAIAKKAARSDVTILLQGETGTGKELFAQAIHHESKRAGQPFIAVNCGAIPPNLVESELFGYEEGAFTGARRRMPGKFEAANGGTLLLDEIGDMLLQTQISLLRVLQEKQVMRVGSNRTIPVDVRVIAATHQDLAQKVKEKNFRLDLYYRLNVISIQIPPLRKREGDVLFLVDYFLQRFSAQAGKVEFQLAPATQKLLQEYRWPGNVRELENALARAISICEGNIILPKHLPPEIRRVTIAETTEGRPMVSLEEIEAKAITDTLQKCQGNVAQTARLLGIGRNTLYRKMQKLSLKVPE